MRRTTFAACAALLASISILLASPAALGQQAAVPDYVAFTRQLKNGLVTVDALALPEPFLQRVADRSLRSHFRMLYRKVAAGEESEADAAMAPAANDQKAAAAQGEIRVVDEAIPTARLEPWATTRNDVPELRGFRAPFPEAGEIEWRMQADDAKRAAAKYVAERLTRDGLVRTTLDVIRKHDLFAPGAAIELEALAGVGIPVDLLAMHVASGKPMSDALQQWWNEGGSEPGVNALVDRARLEFQATRPGFRAMAEDGSEAVGLLRLQLSSAQHASGIGDGSPVDVVRQLACADIAPGVITSVHVRQLPTLLSAAEGWAMRDRSRMTIVSTPAYTSQWAQDSAKTGTANDADGRAVQVTLLPRFASVNEQMTKCAAADSLVFESLRPVVGEVAMSPLLFQGGNMLCVNHPNGDRMLLVGEAEIHRNRALGLSEREVIGALRREFRVDKVEVLPAVSFHIDVELTVRRVGNELVAVVGDDVAAARLLLAEALRGFARAGIVDEATAQRSAEELRDGRQRDVLALVGAAIAPHIAADGKISGAPVEALRTSPLDVPAAVLGRVLHAVDLLTAVEARRNKQPLSSSAHERAYRESLLRRLDERAALAARLADLGMLVVHVPNLGDEELGVNVINAVHLTDATLIPVSGGICKAIDDAAAEAYAQAFGESVAIVPIVTTYVQSTYGGVHCVVSTYPQLEQ